MENNLWAYLEKEEMWAGVGRQRALGTWLGTTPGRVGGDTAQWHHPNQQQLSKVPRPYVFPGHRPSPYNPSSPGKPASKAKRSVFLHLLWLEEESGWGEEICTEEIQRYRPDVGWCGELPSCHHSSVCCFCDCITSNLSGNWTCKLWVIKLVQVCWPSSVFWFFTEVTDWTAHVRKRKEKSKKQKVKDIILCSLVTLDKLPTPTRELCWGISAVPHHRMCSSVRYWFWSILRANCTV